MGCFLQSIIYLLFLLKDYDIILVDILCGIALS